MSLRSRCCCERLAFRVGRARCGDEEGACLPRVSRKELRERRPPPSAVALAVRSEEVGLDSAFRVAQQQLLRVSLLGDEANDAKCHRRVDPGGPPAGLRRKRRWKGAASAACPWFDGDGSASGACRSGFDFGLSLPADRGLSLCSLSLPVHHLGVWR